MHHHTIIAVLAVGLFLFLGKKVRIMSKASVDRLNAAAKAAVLKISTLESDNASLTSQLAEAQASAGASDSELDPVSLELEQSVTPPVPAPAPSPDPSATPATT